jgi:hypothetical protein
MKNTTPRHPILIRLCDQLNERNEQIFLRRSFPELFLTAEEVLEELE